MAMSALPLKADIVWRLLFVGFVPEEEIVKTRLG
jgi:hypothetical protein